MTKRSFNARWMHRGSWFLSWILHPSFVPTYTVFLLFRFNRYLDYMVPAGMKYLMFFVVFLTTFFFPVSVVYVMVKTGLVDSMNLRRREERQLPYIITCVFYFAGYYLLSGWKVPKIFLLVMLGATFSAVLAMLVNFRWKISIHMVGMGGLTGIFYALSGDFMQNMIYLLTGLFLLSGALGTSRIITGKHTPMQIYIGYIAGFLISWLVFY